MKLKTPEAVAFTRDQLKSGAGRQVSDHLERGRLVMFPEAPIGLPAEEEIAFLREVTPRYHKRKNISYYPEADKVNGMGGPRKLRERTCRILKEHHARVQSFLKEVIPSLAEGWATATSSLRAFQEKDRDIPRRQRSDMLHLDAGTYGATHGDLILRFFTNLDDEDRIWRVKGTVADLVEKYGSAAGLRQKDLVGENLLHRMRSAVLRGLATVFPMARSLDSSPYDRAMRRMHNYMKESDAFQADPEGACDVHFKPRSCWTVFADMAGHACKWGRFTIIDTFLVPRENFGDPRRTPYEVLRRYGAGESVVPEEARAPA